MMASPSANTREKRRNGGIMYWNDVYARDARTRVDAEERAYSNIKRISSVHYKKTHRTQPKHKPAKQPSAIWKMASNAVETVAVSAGKLADSNLPSKAATILSKPSTHTKLMLIIAAAFVITTITSINSFATSVPETQEMPMPEDIPAAEEAQDYVHNGFDDIDHSELWQQVNASDFVCLDIDEKVDLIIGSYEENLKQFKNPNIAILGNPQSSKAYEVKEDKNVIKDLGLDPNKKTVVIFMGSLGSSSVNEKLIDYFALTDGSYQIVYATGKSHYEETMQKVEAKDHIRIFERIDGVKVMKNASLLICRAGATTIAEICAIGMPSILIPSPFVPNNHQYYNGKALTDKDAAIMIEEKNLDPKMLNELVNSVINDEVKLKTLGDNARKMGNPNVLNDIVEAIEKL